MSDRLEQRTPTGWHTSPSGHPYHAATEADAARLIARGYRPDLPVDLEVQHQAVDGVDPDAVAHAVATETTSPRRGRKARP